jgi:hypothetical protein
MWGATLCLLCEKGGLMTNNPLIAKWEELNKKKEPPKLPKIEDYEGEETIADELKKSKLKPFELDPEFVKQLEFVKQFENKSTFPIDTTTKNPPSLKTYDPDDSKVSFQQVADKIQQGKAQVLSMSMERDIMGIMRNKIIFEVSLDDY